MTVVLVSSPLYGDCLAIARTIQRDRLELEMCYGPPDGTEVVVRITGEGDPVCTMSARATARRTHYDQDSNARSVEFRVEEWS